MSEWRRIVIDSRFRTSDSTSNSDFYVELPYNVTVEKGSLAYIDAVSMSHSWPTVQEGVNDRIYVQELPNGISGATIDRVVTLTPGSYNALTLATELQTKLRLSTAITSGQYIVVEQDGVFTIGHTSPQASGLAFIYSKESTDEPATYLKTKHDPYPKNGNSANELIGFLSNPSLPYLHSTNSIKCTFVDLQRHKQVFIHSPGLGESSMMTLQGSTDVVRRVLLGSATQGSVVTDVLQTGLHSISFTSEQELKRLHFLVKGYDGLPIAMSGHQISFELIIQRPNEQ